MQIFVFGDRFTARQTQTTITIAIDASWNPRGFVWTYPLDGTVSNNLPVGPTGPQSLVSTTAWFGPQLVLLTRGPEVSDGKTEVYLDTRTMGFNADGTLRIQAPWGRNHALIDSVYEKVQ
jgi:hypothetical protein